jgi:plastocyanin
MIKPIVQSSRRIVFWLFLFCLLALLSIAVVDMRGAMAAKAPTNPVEIIKETKKAGHDLYYFSPTTLTVKKGTAVTFTNQTDSAQVINQGDASKAKVNVNVPVHGSTNATFNVPGTFNLKSNKGAVLRVTVQ